MMMKRRRHLMVCEKFQHSSSFVVYIFFYPTAIQNATKEKGKQEKKDTIFRN